MDGQEHHNNSVEERVFNLLKQKLIPELSDKYYFPCDYPKSDIRDLSRPDLIGFKQIDEDEVSLIPYEIKTKSTYLNLKQISPFTLMLLTERESFYNRMMDALEERGMQNMHRSIEEGALLIDVVRDATVIAPQLAYNHDARMRKDLESQIADFKARYGFYLSDTYWMKIPNRDAVPFGVLYQSVKEINPLCPKESKDRGMLYSASWQFGKKLKSYQLLVEFASSSRIFKVCPFIDIPKSV